MPRVARISPVGVAAALVALAAPVRAQPAPAQPAPASPPAPTPAPTPATAPRRRVELAISAAPAARAALESSVVELLERLSVALEVREVERVPIEAVVTPRVDPSRPLPVARMWLDAGSEPGVTTLYIVDAPWERVLIRRVPTRGTDDEVAREELALIVQDAVAALLAGARIGLDRRAVASAVAPPPRPPPRPRLVRFDLGAFYEAQVFAPQATWAHGPAVCAGFVLGPPGAPRLAAGAQLTAQYRAPAGVPADPLGVQLEQAALRLLAVGELRAHARVRLRLALGGGVDLVNIEPVRAASAGANVTADPERVVAVAVGRAALGVEFVIAGPFALGAQLGADLDLSGTYYFAQDAAAERALVTPRAVRPFAAIGFTFGI